MKPMKVAAIVAGSLVAAGAAAPAFAADLTPSSLNGGLDTLARQTTTAAEPLAEETLNTEEEGSLLNTVKGATNDLNKAKQGAPDGLLGGLPVGGV
ncbi:hypothetical protein [Streptomyces sp. NPDC059909]|uniref:hypothetical protein n=1 Tax=Streptomyces sp. NPDC059909 TaxID=3346998 RepID=UPI003663AAEA